MRILPPQAMFIFPAMVVASFALSGCDSAGAPAAVTVAITPPLAPSVDTGSAVDISNLSLIRTAAPTPSIDPMPQVLEVTEAP
jgi:hypothetical protein